MQIGKVLGAVAAIALGAAPAHANPAFTNDTGLIAGVEGHFGMVLLGSGGGTRLPVGVEADAGYRLSPRFAALGYGGASFELGGHVTTVNGGAALRARPSRRAYYELQLGARRITDRDPVTDVVTRSTCPELGVVAGIPLVRRERAELALRASLTWVVIPDARNEAVYRIGLAFAMF